MDIDIELTRWIRARDLLVGYQINRSDGAKLLVESIYENNQTISGRARNLAHKGSFIYYYPIDELINISDSI